MQRSKKDETRENGSAAEARFSPVRGSWPGCWLFDVDD